MKRKNLVKRIVSLVLVAAFFVTFMPQTVITEGMAEDYQAQLNELNKKYEELEKEQKKINNNINKAKSDKEKQLAQKTQISGQIDLTKDQINLLDEKISILTDNINEKQSMIESTQKDIEDGYDLFKKRLRAMYMTGDASTLGLILGADSFSEFLTRLEVVGRVSEHDVGVLERLLEQKKNIEEIKSQLDKDMEQLEINKDEMENKQNDLNGKMDYVNKQIQDIAAMEEQYKSDSAKVKKQLEAMKKEIDDVFAKLNSTGEYVGGIFAWPVPGFTTVTSDYGWRFNNTDYHTGIDISGSGVYGKPIIAANNGEVVFVQTSYVPGVGYGKYVIIDHGGGIQTLYAHTNEVYVSVGQKVSRGDTIAAVGSTGWSTGPHLHFEVRVNKKHVSPWTYLK